MSLGYVMSGIGTLGADDAPKMTLLKILNGDMYDELVDAKAENYDQLSTIMQYIDSPNPATKAAAQKAQAANFAARQAIQGAISQYSQIVGWIQTVVGKSYAPKQLAGLGSMGFFGIDDAGYVLAAVAAAGFGIAAALYALDAFTRTITGKTEEAKGWMSQFADVEQGASDFLKMGTIAAVVGVALWFGITKWRERRAA